MRRLTIFIGLAFLFTINGAALADGPTTHTVAWGERVYSIARLYGVTPEAIAAANGISVNSWVYVGQRLVIPSGKRTVGASPSGFYVVHGGDTLYSIATKFRLSVSTLAAANNLPADGVIYVGWSLKIPGTVGTGGAAATAQRTTAHIVQAGEYLVQIAMRYGTTTQAIVQANDLSNEWLIYPGQRLVIPGALAGPADAAPVNAATTEIRLSGVPLLKQQQTLTCEEASAAMASRGRVSESRLVAVMPRNDNPFKGIRGRTNSPYFGGLADYGVYAQGLQAGLNALGVSSQVLYGSDYEDFKASLLAHLKAGRPVIWWQTWHDTYQAPVTVKATDGANVRLVPYEHAGVIVGANDRGVTYQDPYDATVRFVSWADHKRVSGYFGNMALVIP